MEGVAFLTLTGYDVPMTKSKTIITISLGDGTVVQGEVTTQTSDGDYYELLTTDGQVATIEIEEGCQPMRHVVWPSTP